MAPVLEKPIPLREEEEFKRFQQFLDQEEEGRLTKLALRIISGLVQYDLYGALSLTIRSKREGAAVTTILPRWRKETCQRFQHATSQEDRRERQHPLSPWRR